ncbi:MAG: hypothetical protein MZV64_11995 [Ignavibacteriales bacterium]|nr:hypothetical protein [Ignavibacteriales bacterium]
MSMPARTERIRTLVPRPERTARPDPALSPLVGPGRLHRDVRRPRARCRRSHRLGTRPGCLSAAEARRPGRSVPGEVSRRARGASTRWAWKRWGSSPPCCARGAGSSSNRMNGSQWISRDARPPSPCPAFGRREIRRISDEVDHGLDAREETPPGRPDRRRRKRAGDADERSG